MSQNIEDAYAQIGVELVPCGVNWKAPCPFHAEEEPSFFVFGDNGDYHCFGCGAHGTLKEVLESMGSEYRILTDPGHIYENPIINLSRLKKKYLGYVTAEMDTTPKSIIFKAFDALDRLFVFAKSKEDELSPIDLVMFIKKKYSYIESFIKKNKL